ncbi:hypothetical protein ABZ946_11955 [Streptomyces sp. NPDC046324]|uniref:hypothetical protein n=1 Tax=Streptomyces sp. NPDC046324 TaxID=3154915 RepID=UPI0033C948A0
MRKLMTAAVAAGLFLGGAGVAVADGWHKLPHMETQGLIADGSYKWEPRGENHGGFHFKVSLEDADPLDGHNVYVESKVEGYSWSRLYGAQRKTVTLDKVIYDGAAQITSEAWIRACRDRGSLRPDNCAKTVRRERPEPRHN